MLYSQWVRSVALAVQRRLAPGLTMLAASIGTAAAQAPATPTAEQLIQQLECRAGQDCHAPPAASETPLVTRSHKRGLSGPGTGNRGAAEPGSGAGTKRSFRFEATTEQGRQEVEKRVETGKLPSTDLEVYFDFNSSVVRYEAQQALKPLATALADPRLAGYRFVLVGHTDAKGGDAFNQRLSQQRAEAVRSYLISQFGIAAGRLDAYGRGKTLLKNSADPLAPENRRVQVINQGTVAQSR